MFKSQSSVQSSRGSVVEPRLVIRANPRNVRHFRLQPQSRDLTVRKKKSACGYDPQSRPNNSR